jgi:hypothetical protein
MYELIQFIQPSETDYHVCTHKSIACPTTAITAVNVPGYDVLGLDKELLKAVNQLRAQQAQYRTKLYAMRSLYSGTTYRGAHETQEGVAAVDAAIAWLDAEIAA